MKKIILAISLLLIGLLVVSCAPREEPLTDEEKAQLQQLSDAELLEVATAENQAAVVGQAVSGAKLKGFKAEARAVLQTRMLTQAQFNSRLLQAAQQNENLKAAIGENGMPTVIFLTGETFPIPDRQGATGSVIT